VRIKLLINYAIIKILMNEQKKYRKWVLYFEFNK